MQAINNANAQHTLAIVHECLGFRKAIKKEKEDCLKTEVMHFICCNHCAKKRNR
jgi:hypothetical protein